MHKAKVTNNNNQMSNSNMETESDESLTSTNLDLSLLRKPIQTSVTGFDEVLRAYESGTNELKKLLSKECDLIYECKVCRNIFRSLTNFISHKRVYCRSSFNASEHFHFQNNGFMVQDVSTIIQAEQKITNNPNGIAGVSSGSDDKSKDLSGIVEQLLWKQHQSMNSNVNDFYDQIQTSSKRTSAPSTQDDVSSTSSMLNNKKTHLLKLNRVNDSDIAVYQSLHTENDNSNMKDEINEVHKMLSKSNTVLGPDGKLLNLFNSNSRKDSPALSAEEGDGPYRCQVCSVQFETQKTLKLHLEMKHLPSTFVYQCPSCSQKFSSSAAVIRHLSNDHKKSNRRIRLMRDNIIKKRVRADEVVSKTPSTSRELQKLQISNGTDTTSSATLSKNHNSEWNEQDLNTNSNGDLDDSYTCPSCMKKFDRKAVYTSHVQMCSDIKDREQEKIKKRKAKMKTNLHAMESENSNVSEQTTTAATSSHEISQNLQKVDDQKQSSQTDDQANASKRKRKKAKKTKTEDEVISSSKMISEPMKEDSEDVVDWNLDDEEEKKKIENIRKEIIEDEYKKNLEIQPIVNKIRASPIQSQTSTLFVNNNDDDDEENGLVIDLKGSEKGLFKCPTCDKVFVTDEKLKYHLTYYHSRQKRFKCKMCEYQGYRKKDTMNHINFVHNAGITLEELPNHIETVSKAVDEEAVAKQNELKKNQLRIKRKMAREKQRKKLNESKNDHVIVSGENTEKLENKEPEKVNKINEEEPKTKEVEVDETPSKIRRVSSTNEINAFEMSSLAISPTEMNENSENLLDHRELGTRACKSPFEVDRFGSKISPTDDQSHQRPIRNRIKPVRKDFLYDLSDLLKKEADAYREQVFQSSNVTVKRELRKRSMTTHTRETPNLNYFDQSISKSDESFVQPLAPPSITEENIAPTNLKDQRKRRMSVFVASPRQMYPATQPRSPPYKPPDAGTHKNAGSAHRMALAACEKNNASMYEPKHVWNVNFDKDLKTVNIPKFSTSLKSTSIAPVSTASSSNFSAASSILQKLSGHKIDDKVKPQSPITNTNSLLKPRSNDEKPSKLTTADLCKKFELINMTNINESEFDISNSDAINLNPGGNNLLSLNLNESENEMCVLQECTNSEDEDDSEPRLEIESGDKKSKRGQKYTKKRSADKRRLSPNGRMTLMQRIQENKIRKTREQLFQRLMNQQNENENEDESVSSVSMIYLTKLDPNSSGAANL